MVKVNAILTIVLVIFFSSCDNNNNIETGNVSVREVATPFYVENNQFKKDGYTFLVHGINVAGDFKTPFFGKYGYFGNVTEANFKWMREDLGFNVARLLAEWSGIEPERNFFDDNYIEEYAKRVSWAAKYNMYVFIDMHQDVYGMGFTKYWGNGAPLWSCPLKNYEEQPDVISWEAGYLTPPVLDCEKRFWSNVDSLWYHFGESVRRIMEKFSNHPYVMGLEIMNEPFWGPWGPITFEKEYLYPFYVYVGNIIREVAPKKVIFFEPSTSRNFGFPTYLPKLNFPQLAYAPHFYFTALDFGMSYSGGATEMIKDELKMRIGEAMVHNSVPIIGEFGAWVDKESVINYLTDLFNGFDDLQMNIVQWEITDVQRKFADEINWQRWIDIVVRAYPELWKGELVKMSYDTKEKSLLIKWNTNSGDDMIVTLPKYVYNSNCLIVGDTGKISYKWINSYQIRITATTTGSISFVVRSNLRTQDEN